MNSSIEHQGHRRTAALRKSLYLAAAAAFLGIATPQPARALSIIPTYSPNLTASAITTIGNALTFYEMTFADPITIRLEFHAQSNGLGESTFVFNNFLYADVYAALIADATTADDATALANTPGGAFNPVNGGSQLSMKSANAKALGLGVTEFMFSADDCKSSDPGFSFTGDACIGLNLSITDDQDPLGYGLATVVQHEVNEALGLGSRLNGGYMGENPAMADLFRWASAGVRSFATNPATDVDCTSVPTPNAFFSIDRGITNLNQFNNCSNGGDYGDWITHTPSQIQDAATDNSGKPTMVFSLPEARYLDVIGYNLLSPTKAVPEPGALVLLAFGLGAAGRKRMTRGRRG